MKIKEFKSIICMLDRNKYNLMSQGVRFTMIHKEKTGDYSMLSIGEWRDMSLMSLIQLFEMWKVAYADSRITKENFMKSVTENFYRYVENRMNETEKE